MISIFFTVLLRSIYEMFFYTQWTFGLVTIYFGLGTLLSAQGCWKYSKQSYRGDNEERNIFIEDTRQDIESPVNSQNEPTENYNHLTLYDNKQGVGWLGYVMQITYQICAGSAVLTDIVFWMILAPSISNGQFGLVEGCMHSLNIVFLLLDMSLNSLPFPFFRIAYFIIWTCAYGIFQWILHACGVSWWPYPFMDLTSPWAPVWYFLIAFVQLPCYGLCFGIAKAKNTLLPKLFPLKYIKSN
ncbi:hypothetical protein ZOSMA_92G00490 [Zostera marina]|uniref:Transmembrane protein n=1 Tax=Zostera marina TaxID=29655 RepID=A0A0K9NJ99_ZOSMR|nr:hypothetical protein ZOSMA_92G00490 [Zostera marina]